MSKEIMSMSDNRTLLRDSVIDTLLKTFGGAQKVVGGVAFLSTEYTDEETGAALPVELKVSVKRTQDTTRGKAYDLDAEVEKFATRPGRRVADPAKKAASEAAKAASAERRAANVAILRDWVKKNLPEEGMIPSQFQQNVPGFEDLDNMKVGTYLMVLAKEGVLNWAYDEKRHRVYTLAK